MRLLLDTHIFLWYITADPKLPAAFRSAVQDPGNEVYLSVASVWEAVIKHSLGKFPLPGPPADYLPQQRVAHRIASVPVDEGAMAHLSGLPLLHRDPFDRLIVAQALQHGLMVATIDPEIAAYPIPLLSTG